MYALNCLFEEELRKKMTETYMAEHTWIIANALYSMAGNKLDTPRYTELIEPALKNADTRTPTEIINDFIAKLD